MRRGNRQIAHIHCRFKNGLVKSGCVIPHTRVGDSSPNADICIVRALASLFSSHRANFAKSREKAVSSRTNGVVAPAAKLTAQPRAATSSHGNIPSSFSSHPLRAGGATALYRATRDIEFAARFRSWGTISISVYLRRSRQLYAGLWDAVVAGGRGRMLRHSPQSLKE